MGEIAERTNAVIGRAVGNTVAPAVTALMTSAGIALGHPELVVLAVPAGATAGSLTEEGVALVRRAWLDKAERVGRFADAAAEAAGVPIETLMEQALDSPKVRELLHRAVESASTSVDDEKIEMLARAFVRGAKDGSVVDEMLMLAALLREVEVPHVRLMAALRSLHVDVTLTGQPHVGGASRPTATLLASGSIVESTVQDIATVDGGLIPALPYIVLPLSRMGFLEITTKEQNDDGGPAAFACRLTPIGMEVAVALENVGRYSTLEEFRRLKQGQKSPAPHDVEPGNTRGSD